MVAVEGLHVDGRDRWRLHTDSHCYATLHLKRDAPLFAFARSAGAKIHEPGRTTLGGTSILWGFDEDAFMRQVACLRNNQPFLFLDHAYQKRGYENGNYRLVFNHFHQCRLLPVTKRRSVFMHKRLEDWKRGGQNIVVIRPSDRVSQMLHIGYGVPWKNNREWTHHICKEIKRHTDRPIVVKEKGGGLLNELKKAHAVVSLSSVAEVEALIYGIPVFVSEHSPCAPISQPLDRIESPEYGDRDQVLTTLSYAQFTQEELRNGTAWGTLRELYGNHDIR